MKIGIIGTGAYGISLARVFDENNNEVIMWTRFEEEKKEIEATREYKKVLPNIKISDTIKVTTSLDKVCDSDIIVIAIPAKAVDWLSHQVKGYIKDQIIVIASKGIEQNSCMFLNEVWAKYNPTNNLAVIAGGSFAIDIASGFPVGLSIASHNNEVIKTVKNALENKHFKLRETNDIIGVEVCSSIKNVVAIAAGILDALGANESTKCMFVTESLHDIMELINNLGGDTKTILSFAGFGDILLTCTSTKSRNFSFGKCLASSSKNKIEEYKNTHTIEGLYTLDSIKKIVDDKKIDVGIINLIYDIVYNDKDPNSLFDFLIEKR